MERPSTLDLEAVKRIVPHRPPFLFVEWVSQASKELVVAHRKVDPSEPWFAGHFPDRPVLPGVLITEAMAQALLILYSYHHEMEHLFFLAKDESRFLSPVVPGDELRIEARPVRYRKTMGVGEATAFVGETKVATSRITFAASK